MIAVMIIMRMMYCNDDYDDDGGHVISSVTLAAYRYLQILQELPEVYSNFQRRKMINDTFMIVKGTLKIYKFLKMDDTIDEWLLCLCESKEI